MIIKELKKILFSKIIIALLISLCIVNVLYETRTQIETKEQIAAQDKLQKNKIDNYGKYLIKIKEDGTNMQSIVLFSKNNKFQLNNAKRTVKAYEAVKNVKPVYGNYKVIEKITEFGLTDIILFVMVVQIALILVSQEIKKGMLDLLKSCRDGRLNLIVNKMTALSITSAIAIIIVYGIKFIQSYIKYGLSGINVPIQSVRGFYEFALPMQIWQYMIIYFMVKWIAVCIIGIVVIGIISLVKNETVTYGIILISTAVSLLITNSIEWNMSTAVFKMLSPVTLLNTKSFMAKYININILQHPFELFKWTLIIMAVYLSASIVFAMYSFTTKRVIKFPHLRIAKGQKNIGIKSKGILSYEKKKIFAVNKVAFFVIILVVIQGYFLSNDNTKMDYHDKCYANYISKVYGVPDKKSQEYLDAEQKRYNEIQVGYDELTEKYEALSAAPAAADGSCGASARNSRPRCITRTEKSHSEPPNGRLRRSVPLRDHRPNAVPCSMGCRDAPGSSTADAAALRHWTVSPSVRKTGWGKAPRTHNRSSSSKKSPPLRHAGRGR